MYHQDLELNLTYLDLIIISNVEGVAVSAELCVMASLSLKYTI